MALGEMQRIADWMPGGFFIYRAGEGEEILYANAAMLRLFGCAGMEELLTLTGGSFRGVVHPEDYETVEKSIWEQIGDNQYDLDYVEYRIIRRDGAIRWVEDYGHYVRQEDGSALFYVFISDATEKRQRQVEARNAIIRENIKKEEQLRSRLESYHRELEGIGQEHLRQLEVIECLSLDYVSIFYADLDQDAVQSYRSSGRVEMGGGEGRRRFRGFVSAYIKTWVHPDDRAAVNQALNPGYIREQLAAQKLFSLTYRIVIRGEIEYLQLRIVNAGEPGQAVSRVVIGCRSVDGELKNGLKQRAFLEKALKQANTAVIARNAFLSNMSHDMRTPMNAVMGFTALARKHMDERGRLLECLDVIERSGGQLLRLIDNVLEIARFESGKVTLAEEDCDLLAIAQKIQADLLPQAAGKAVSLTLDATGLRHTAIRGDRQLLSQILSRLASNAVKYTNAGGSVSIVLQELETAPTGYRTYRLAVSDTGIGIHKEFLQHIFEPFERESNTTFSGIYGTGLGLTIVKSSVDMMGGTVDVWSEVGQGSRFTVTLPLRTVGEHLASGPRFSPAGSAPRGKLLVVEDNELNRAIEIELLEDAGFSVESAENGLMAVEKIQAALPGEYVLVLMDIQMPVMDGYHAARAIRALPDPAKAGIPIIAVSANSFEEDRRLSMESGMNAHLPKPIDAPGLLEQIEAMLRTAPGTH